MRTNIAVAIPSTGCTVDEDLMPGQHALKVPNDVCGLCELRTLVG